jgi:hypothetical protein
MGRSYKCAWKVILPRLMEFTLSVTAAAGPWERDRERADNLLEQKLPMNYEGFGLWGPLY